ncbi:MAG TPA: ADYC domain-containing protein [Archangium sp.]|uniref:ADYC domain-containing protein n=1 Tax=Archangium sp. TaxID=1872627 RepID=UPI002E336FBE|nr:ADYC domain-containing protein [Archangium sp.]HEX5751988.1 ADYC domain-containing protein [Archangium sp.]
MIGRETRHGLKRLGLSTVLALLTLATRAGAANEGYEGQQGTRLHGTAPELFERVSIPLTSATTLGGIAIQQVVIDKGQLKSGVPALKGAQWSGARFNAWVKTELVTFQISQAQPHRNVYADPDSPESLSATVWEYEVKWSSPALGSGELCPGSAALVLPGSWNGARYAHSTTTFSFACLPRRQLDGTLVKGGVAAKCVDWGYPPWTSEDPRLDNSSLSLTEMDAIRHHLACTAMATADFCGEARPNTLDGTPITLFHQGNVRSEVVNAYSPPVVSGGPLGQGFFFEAAWVMVDASTGQPLLSAPHFPTTPVRAQALCLTKKRWATLPPAGTCTIQGPLVDPRSAWMDPRQPRPPSRYCEEYSRDELIQNGAVLFSYSRFLDAGLFRFKRNNEHTQYTDQFLSTAHIVINPQPPYTYQPDPSLFPNADEYVLDTRIALGFEGPLFKFDAPATVLDGLPVRRLLRYRQKDGTGRFVTLVEGAPVPADHQLDLDARAQGVEGHVRDGLAPATTPRPLHLYGNGSDYLTSTQGNVPDFMQRTASPMGYMPSLADYAAQQP